MRLLRLVLILLIFPLTGEARHIMGGEIYYDDLGGGNYQITLKLYRDCINSAGVPFDNPAVISVFDNSGNFIKNIKIPFTSSSILPSSINSPCFVQPPNICVDYTTYSATVNLPPIVGGYNLVHQRCCRNNSILNLTNPGTAGATYSEHIPGSEVVATNSSPRFTTYPPNFTCAGVDINLNNIATDPDGDSLVYSLCNPYNGLDACCPLVQYTASVSGCTSPPPGGMCDSIASPPPFSALVFNSPYSGGYPISSNPAVQINSQTGHLTGTPNITGQWVVTICVAEYRNGVLLGTHSRDFQFNVVTCQNLIISNIQPQVQSCTGLTINFNNLSTGATHYLWNFGDGTTMNDTSTLKNPSYTYPDSGKYTVTLIVYGATPGCNDTSTQVFSVYPALNPGFTPPAGQCIVGNSFNFTAGGQFASYSTFSWNFTNFASPTGSTAQNPNGITFNQYGNFPVTLTIKEKNCIKSFTDTVHVYPNTVSQFTMTNTNGCQPLSVSFINQSMYGIGEHYLWNFGDGDTSSAKNPVHVYQNTGTFNVTLTVNTTAGCVGSNSSTIIGQITVLPGPKTGFIVKPTHTDIYHNIITFTDTSKNITQQTVTMGNGVTLNYLPQSYEYEDCGTFVIEQIATSSNGCSDTTIHSVVIDKDFTFYVPNCFSPNSDSHNRIFKPMSFGIYDYTMTIYDRWGKKVFESSDKEAGWDGTYHGKKCPEDIYVYTIDFNNILDDYPRSIQGKVTLIR
ncbi:MAG: PKD domain-containing protein [Bacteroidia bacterium]